MITLKEGSFYSFGFGYWYGEQIPWNYTVSISFGSASSSDVYFHSFSGSLVGGTIDIPVEILNDSIDEGDEIFAISIVGTYGPSQTQYSFEQDYTIEDVQTRTHEEELLNEGRITAEEIASNTLQLTELLAHLDEIATACDRRIFLKGFGETLDKFNSAFDAVVAATNVAVADNHAKAAFIETVNWAAVRAAFGLGESALLLSGVGAPVAIVGGLVAGFVFTNTFGSDLQRAAGAFWDAHVQPNGSVKPADQMVGLADLVASVPSAIAFDAHWYLATYADARAAVSSGQVPSAMAYYLQYGIHQGELPNPTAAPISPSDIAIPSEFFINGIFRTSIFELSAGQMVGDGISAEEASFTNLVAQQRSEPLLLDAALSTLANRKAIDVVHNLDQDPATHRGTADSIWAAAWSSGQSFAEGAQAIIGENANLTMIAVPSTGQSAQEALTEILNSALYKAALLSTDNTRIGVAEYGGVWVVMLGHGPAAGTPIFETAADTTSRNGTEGADVIALGTWAGSIDGRGATMA